MQLYFDKLYFIYVFFIFMNVCVHERCWIDKEVHYPQSLMQSSLRNCISMTRIFFKLVKYWAIRKKESKIQSLAFPFEKAAKVPDKCHLTALFKQLSCFKFYMPCNTLWGITMTGRLSKVSIFLWIPIVGHRVVGGQTQAVARNAVPNKL